MPQAQLGAHVSSAGGLQQAFGRAQTLGCEALQIFVKNASRWRAKALTEGDIALFRETHQAHAALPVMAHSSYLINLCATNPGTLERSRRALQDELERCHALGVAGLVLHPGAHTGAGEEAGLEAVARSLDEVFAQLPQVSTKVLLENTAGQGTVLGHHAAQLRQIIEQVDDAERLGVCFDSCHAFAAGYPLNHAEGYDRAVDAFACELGDGRLMLVHLNDSQYPCGAHKDRHANIGEGELGEAFFERLLHDPRLAGLPMILETPLGEDGEGHARDLARLKALRAG